MTRIRVISGSHPKGTLSHVRDPQYRPRRPVGWAQRRHGEPHAEPVGPARRLRPAPGARRGAESVRTLRALLARRLRRRLGDDRRAAPVPHRGAERGGAHHHHPQPVARHLLRPLGEPLSRLRARLRLLLRPADPRLYGPVARPRLRIQALRQAECRRASGGGVVQARLRAALDRHRHQHGPLSADREDAPDNARDPRSARAGEPSRGHRDEVGTGDARHRYPTAHGGQGTGAGGRLRHHHGPASGAHDGAARGDARQAFRRRTAADGGGRADDGDDGPIIPGLPIRRSSGFWRPPPRPGRPEVGYVLLRLPLEVSPLFKEWLLRHYPNRYRT